MAERADWQELAHRSPHARQHFRGAGQGRERIGHQHQHRRRQPQAAQPQTGAQPHHQRHHGGYRQAEHQAVGQVRPLDGVKTELHCARQRKAAHQRDQQRGPDALSPPRQAGRQEKAADVAADDQRQHNADQSGLARIVGGGGNDVLHAGGGEAGSGQQHPELVAHTGDHLRGSRTARRGSQHLEVSGAGRIEQNRSVDFTPEDGRAGGTLTGIGREVEPGGKAALQQPRQPLGEGGRRDQAHRQMVGRGMHHRPGEDSQQQRGGEGDQGAEAQHGDERTGRRWVHEASELNLKRANVQFY